MDSQVLEQARTYEKSAETEIHAEDRPGFHLSPRTGWMNDPNGFSYYNGQYHLFYQYYPYEPRWGGMHWGHAVSRDLLHWDYLPVALAPDQHYDREGCFSGSALEMPDGRHMLMYTGVSGESHPEGGTRCAQTQCLAFGDGVNYEKYPDNPVIGLNSLPAGASKVDFRDPKLWREKDGTYRCIAASCDQEADGQILYYRSYDGVNWKYESVLAKNYGRFGKMWECPDFFELDGSYVLLVSPMEMEAQGDEYRCGGGTLCLIGSFDDEKKQFTAKHDQAIDYGIDFYATQTLLTPDGRRIMVAWMQNWETWEHYNPGQPWQGQMTIPRELSVKNGRLCQWPVRELKQLRRNPVRYVNRTFTGELQLDGINGRKIDMKLSVRPVTGEEPYRKFELYFAQDKKRYAMIRFIPDESVLEIDRSHSGSCHAVVHQCRSWVQNENGRIDLRLVLDYFSAEIFVNDGQQVLTITLFTNRDAEDISFFVAGKAEMNVEKYDLL